MPRAARRPLDERARTRLREAQRLESDAVAVIHAAAIRKESTQAKLDALIAEHQVAIDAAEHGLCRAHANLVSVSGIARAALLLELPVSVLRAAVRSAAGAGRQEDV
jgi:hypothetical protein